MNYTERVTEFLEELSLFSDWTERYEYIISLGKKLPPMPEEQRIDGNLIQGCQSRVWVYTTLKDGVATISADSDSLITKGLIAIFIRLFSGLPAQEIINADMDLLNQAGLQEHLSSTRANALASMAQRIKSDCRAFC